MKDEILGGLKNALERGDSLEKAAQSFINAGYNPAEVRATAQIFMQGSSQSVEDAPISIAKMPASTPLPSFQSANTIINPPVRKNSGNGKIIIILAGILVFIIGLFLIIYTQDTLLSFFNSLLGK